MSSFEPSSSNSTILDKIFASGLDLFRQKQFENSILELARGLEVCLTDEDRVDFLRLRSQCYLRARQTKAAIHDLQSALGIAYTEATRLNLALAYYNDGNHSEAIECFGLCSSSDQPYIKFMALYHRARLNLSASIEKDISLLKEALALPSLGDTEEQAHSRKETIPDINCLLGLNLRWVHEFTESAHYYRQALQRYLTFERPTRNMITTILSFSRLALVHEEIREEAKNFLQSIAPSPLSDETYLSMGNFISACELLSELEKDRFLSDPNLEMLQGNPLYIAAEYFKNSLRFYPHGLICLKSLYKQLGTDAAASQLSQFLIKLGQHRAANQLLCSHPNLSQSSNYFE